MTRIIPALLLAILVLPSAGAHADPVNQSKLYVTDAKACQALARKGTAAFGELDFMSLSFKDGIQSYEFNCSFFDVKTKKGNDGLLVTAICENPGDRYPDLFSVHVHDGKSIEVVSMHDSALAAANKDGGEGSRATGTILYYRCDNLSELPRE